MLLNGMHISRHLFKLNYEKSKHFIKYLEVNYVTYMYIEYICYEKSKIFSK
jgi:hypothetical protein